MYWGIVLEYLKKNLHLYWLNARIIAKTCISADWRIASLHLIIQFESNRIVWLFNPNLIRSFDYSIRIWSDHLIIQSESDLIWSDQIFFYLIELVYGPYDLLNWSDSNPIQSGIDLIWFESDQIYTRLDWIFFGILVTMQYSKKIKMHKPYLIY